MNKFAFGGLFLSLSLGGSPLAWADAVTDWNANAGRAAIAACLAPAPQETFHESHLRKAFEEGVEHGRKIGERAVEHLLQSAN